MKFGFTSSLIILITFSFVSSCRQQNSISPKSQTSIDKVEVEILSLVKIADTTDHYGLTFGVKADTSRKLTMLVGKWEAQTLAITLEKIVPTSPLPLDIFEDAINKFGYHVQEVVIDSLVNEVYTSKILCSGNGKNFEFKARTTDAATIASKFKCPIYVEKRLLN